MSQRLHVSPRLYLNIALSLAGLASLIGAYFTFEPSVRAQPFAIPFFLTFAIIYVSERISSLLTDIFSDAESKTANDRLNKELHSIPALLSGTHDIVAFRNVSDGLAYAINAITDASSVRSTVLRYGVGTSAMGSPEDMYSKWIDKKLETLRSPHDCHWREIVSTHLDATDLQMSMIGRIKNDMLGAYYRSVSIDDKDYQIAQMCLISFKNRPSELLFGHDFPGMDDGPAFLTRNEKVIEYFGAHFSPWFDRCDRNSGGKLLEKT